MHISGDNVMTRPDVDASDVVSDAAYLPSQIEELSPPIDRMAAWRQWLFRLLMRLDRPLPEVYGIPPDHVHPVDIDVRL